MGFDDIDRKFDKFPKVQPIGLPWFVECDNTDNTSDNVQDLLDDTCDGDILEVEECVTVRHLYAVYMSHADDVEEREYRTFATMEEAVAWVDQRSKEIEAFEKHHDGEGR